MDQKRDISSERLMIGIETRISVWENKRDRFSPYSAEYRMHSEFIKELEMFRTFIKEGKMVKVTKED